MKIVQCFTFLFVAVVGFILTTPNVQAAEKLALPLGDTYTFFAIPFTLAHNKSKVVIPTTAKRDSATSSSVGFTLKTPEGLRQTAGTAVGLVVSDQAGSEHTLYVLFRDTTPTSRVNTLAITHLPFLLVNPTQGTSTQSLNKSELKNFVVKNGAVKPLSDTE